MFSLRFDKFIKPINIVIIVGEIKKLFKFIHALLPPFIAFAIVFYVAYKSIIHRLKRGKLLFLFDAIYGFVMRFYSQCFMSPILAIGIYTDTADDDNATNGIKVLAFGKFHFLRALGCKVNHFFANSMDFQYAILPKESATFSSCRFNCFRVFLSRTRVINS